MKMTILLTFIISLFVFSACQTASTEKASDAQVNTQENAMQNEIKQVTVAQAKGSLTGKDAQFIDVRTEEEYAAGHAVKAVHFPLDALEKDSGKLDKEKPVYVICQTGRRSQKGAEILQKAGFKDIYNIEGGTSAWTSAGYPVEK